jgi:hypothetical protein
MSNQGLPGAVTAVQGLMSCFVGDPAAAMPMEHSYLQLVLLVEKMMAQLVSMLLQNPGL